MLLHRRVRPVTPSFGPHVLLQRPTSPRLVFPRAMSWQAYIDDSLMQPLGGGGTLTHAAICGHDGGVWAQSPDFPGISDDEVAAIMAGFDDSTALATNGLRLGGEKYMMIAGEPGEVLRGKKGPNGVTVKKTNSALVIGIYGEGVTPGECNLVVENLGDYLKEQGI